MNKKICYRKDNKMIVAVKDTDWQFSAKETDGNPFAVVTLDLTQEQLDDIDTNGIAIRDSVSSNSLCMDNAETPTTLERSE